MTEPVPSPLSSTRSPYPYGHEGGSSANLADILERVLDKGIVIVGDIKINLLDIELLTIKLRLLVASVDKAKEIGIDWWEHDPALSSRAHEQRELEKQNERLRAEVRMLRQRADESPPSLPAGEARPGSDHRARHADAERSRPAERPRATERSRPSASPRPSEQARHSEQARDSERPRAGERARGGAPADRKRRAPDEEDRG
ncbi:gas vesicle protein GvpJ [Streptomyces syringium]|uniref:gas vesicle protein n=1 Tax=Streptomyces syringium TaxID=76729 RepID=UPI003F53F6A8